MIKFNSKSKQWSNDSVAKFDDGEVIDRWSGICIYISGMEIEKD